MTHTENTYTTSGMQVYKEINGSLRLVATFEHGMDDDMHALIVAPDVLEALLGAMFFVPLGTKARERADAAIEKAKGA